MLRHDIFGWPISSVAEAACIALLGSNAAAHISDYSGVSLRISLTAG
jgi:hypothetical protein